MPPTVPLRFSVAWSGLDNLSGIRGYDVRYKVGAMGTWQGWLTDTLETEAPFTGIPDATYYFRVMATDNVNNASDWVEIGPITVKSVTKYYTHGGQRVAMRRGDVVYYLHGDHLGSTSLTTDQDQTIVSEARYLPYGQERWANGEAVTDFGFTSQRNERGFGLYDYNARYYSAVLGRFVSPDSIVPEPGSSGGFNRYRYVRNNPLKYVDPTGHLTEDEIMDVFDVETWEEVLSSFEEGGELEGRWGWLETLRNDEPGTIVSIFDEGLGPIPFK